MVQKRSLLYAVAFAMAFLMMGTTAWADIVAVSGLSGDVYRTPGNCSSTLGCGGTSDAGFLTGAIKEGTLAGGTTVNFFASGSDTLNNFVTINGSTYTSLGVVNSFAELTSAGIETTQLMSNCSTTH